MVFFSFSHFVRREGDGRGGQAEQPDRLMFEGWGVEVEGGGRCGRTE